MLEFAVHIAHPMPGCCPSRKASDGVEPFLVRSAKIIYHRLPEVIAIRKWLSRDSGHSCVDGFDAPAKLSVATFSLEFVVEFGLEQAKNLFCLWSTAAFPIHRVRSLLQKPDALIARPRPHPCEPAVNHAHSNQAVKSRINPAVEWYVRRPLIRWRRCSIATKDLANRSPGLTA